MPSSPQDDLTSVITWYDVLGVLPDAPLEDIREAWQARREALQPGLLAGAPPDALSAADGARQAVAEAWRVLADPAARESYDEQIGFSRPGEGLDPHRRGPERLSRVVVPDIRGLFYGACLDVVGRVGLHGQGPLARCKLGARLVDWCRDGPHRRRGTRCAPAGTGLPPPDGAG